MPNISQVSSNIIAALALSEPTLDTTVGSLTRKIIDAVSGAIVENSNDAHLVTYAYDIDSKSAGALDDFVALFGMARIQAQRAVGTVTFSRTAALAVSTAAPIPIGTQVASNTDPVVYVVVLASGLMSSGQTTIDMPVQAINPGPNGNVAAGTLITLATSLEGIPSATNAAALVGGSNAETDEALRTRFKATVFRNLAGTDQMYRAMALQTQADPTDTSSTPVSAVNVIGPRQTFFEQIQLVSGVGQSTIPDAAYIYSNSVFFGANVNGGSLLVPGTGHDYTVTINNAVFPATLVINSISANAPDGTYDLQFDYVSQWSRNDPFGTRWTTASAFVSNRVDVWVNGYWGGQATQACLYTTATSAQFNSTPKDVMQNTRYQLPNGTNPVVGDFFTPLILGPIYSLPNTIVIGATTYVEGTDYDIVHQSDAFGYTPTSRYGIVWHTVTQPGKAAPKRPANNASFSLVYLYNQVPSLVQQRIQSTWRLLGTDVQVHAGIARAYQMNLAVVYNRGVNIPSINTDIDAALNNLIAGLGFDSALQVSDVLQAVHNVSGVDNVRFLTSLDDPTHYGMQLIYPDGTFGPIQNVGGRTTDIYFSDAAYPICWTPTRIVPKAHNTFGVS